MVRTRLDTLPGDLAEQIGKATDEQKRAIFRAACKLAVARTGVNGSLVEMALLSLEKERYDDASVTARLTALIDELDRKYFDAQERYEAGKGTQDAYRKAFQQARAVNAVLFAFDADPFVAEAESLYEVNAPVGMDAIGDVVQRVLAT